MENIIYTGIGDNGTTSLYDGLGVPKYDRRIKVVGTVDELMSFIGLARCQKVEEHIGKLLHEVQRRLFDVGAEVATQDPSILKRTITEEDWKGFEKHIDVLMESFGVPTAFILPGDCPESAHLHVCRSVCRRLERELVELADELGDQLNRDLLIYVNRLSDLFYSMARYCEESYEEVEF